MPGEAGRGDDRAPSPPVPPPLPARETTGPALPGPPPIPGPQATDELPGQIGRFEIRRRLGAGAFGEVYLAHDPVLDREVALKVPRAAVLASSKARARFLREAKAAAQLRHPHIVPVYDAGVDGDQHYIASAFIEGQTLEDVIDEERPDFHGAAQIVRSLAEALDYAHRQGIVHRDVKPGNVMVDADGQALLMDFGLARIEQSNERLTHDGTLMGTPAYMAPEQADSSFGTVGPASDQYSLGVVLYETLCGAPPFSGPSSVVIFNLLHEEPAAPRGVNPAIPRDLETICLKAMAKRPEQRYADCGQLAEDLRRSLVGEPIQARPMGVAERFGRWCKRNPLLAMLSMTAVLLLVAVATVTTVAFYRERDFKKDLAKKVDDLETAWGEIDVLGKRRQKLEEDNAALVQEKFELQEMKAADFLIKLIRDALLPPGEEPKRPSPAHRSASGGRPRAKQAAQGKDDAGQPGAVGPGPVPKPAKPPPPNPPGVSITAEALAGRPFGVGKVTLAYPVGSAPVWHPDQPLWLDEERMRVFYPAFETTELGPRDADQPRRLGEVTAFFLFRGEEPLGLSVTVAAGPVVSVNAIPDLGGDPSVHRALLGRWWERYTRPLDDPYQEYARPRLARACLTGILKRRLDLPPSRRGLLADVTRNLDGWPAYFFWLSGAEWIRRAIQWEAFSFGMGEADQPLPRAVEAPPLEVPGVPPNTPVERLAMHVPEECFYARFASFSDSTWFCSTLGSLTGNLNRLASMRGVDDGTQARLVRQLGFGDVTAQYLSLGFLSSDLRADDPADQSASRLKPTFVDSLVDEVAIIGTDPFFGQGAAVGLIFRPKEDEKRRKMLLDLIPLLRQVVDYSDPEVEETAVDVEGHQVSLLSAPDHSVRSFYAVDGDYHLVTTSRHVVKRFFEAGQGIESLGQSREFRHARNKVPLARGDAVFVYLSTSFLRQLIGPKCLIETLRRQQALADLELVRVAKLAASAEGTQSSSVEELIEAGLLPATIELRADGSHPILFQDGQVCDSLRGAAGTFLPIPDVPLKLVTADEAKLAENARSLSKLVFPLVMAVSRRPGTGADSQRISLDVLVTPLSLERFPSIGNSRSEFERYLPQLAGLLSQPGELRLTSVPGDLMALQVGFRTSAWMMFGGLRDLPVSYTVQNGRVEVRDFEEALMRVGGYVGETGTSGLLQFLVDGTAGFGPKDAQGYGESKGKSAFFRWMRIWNSNWVAFAPQKEILENVTPHLEVEAAERPAQIRFRLADLSESEIARLLRAYGYVHARRTSAANVQLLHEVIEQLHVPPQEARRVAEGLVEGRLECPLGGTYRLEEPNSSAPYWSGTAWLCPSLYEETEVDPEYRTGLVDRFRGMEIELRLTENTLGAHVEIVVAGDAPRTGATTGDVDRRLKRVKALQPGPARLASLRAIVEESPDTPQAKEAERLLVETADQIATWAIEEAGEDPPSLEQLERYRALLGEAPDTELVERARAQVLEALGEIGMDRLEAIMKLASEGEKRKALEDLIGDLPHTKAAEEAAKHLSEINDRLAAQRLEEAKAANSLPLKIKRLFSLIRDLPATEPAKEAERMIDEMLLHADSLPDKADTVIELREIAKDFRDARTKEKATRLADEITAAHKLESANGWLEKSAKSGIPGAVQQKYKRNAISEFQAIARDYPNTSSAKKAQKRLSELR